MLHVEGSASQPSKSLPLKIFMHPGQSFDTSADSPVEVVTTGVAAQLIGGRVIFYCFCRNNEARQAVAESHKVEGNSSHDRYLEIRRRIVLPVRAPAERRKKYNRR